MTYAPQRVSVCSDTKQQQIKESSGLVGSEFLWEKYLSNDPLKMYVAFRIWNSYLLAREPVTVTLPVTASWIK